MANEPATGQAAVTRDNPATADSNPRNPDTAWLDPYGENPLRRASPAPDVEGGMEPDRFGAWVPFVPSAPGDAGIPTGDEVRRVLAWVATKGCRLHRVTNGAVAPVNTEGLALWAEAERE